MIDISPVQNVTQASGSKSRAPQTRSDANKTEAEQAFETEYEAAAQRETDSKAEPAPADNNETEGRKAEADAQSDEADDVNQPIPEETAETDIKRAFAADDDSKNPEIGAVQNEKTAQLQDLEKAPSKGDAEAIAGPVSDRRKALDRTLQTDRREVAAAKQPDGVPVDRTQQTAQATEPKSVTTAETIITSKALQNSQKTDTAIAPNTVTRNAGADNPSTETVAAVAQRPATEAPKTPVTVPLPEQASAVAREVRSKRAEHHATEMMAATPKAPEIQSKIAQATPVAAMVTQVKQITAHDNTDLKPAAVFDIDAGATWETRSTSQTSPHALTQTLARAETPTMIARQMAEALQRLPDRPVEISLNPKELGRVRMNISAAEVGITVNVVAERPETLDLMRRNIEQLAREFQSIGYENINFAFSEGDTQQNFGDEQRDNDAPSATHLDLTEPEETPPHVTRTASATGIDIRL
ncbi:MAG: flagellar hook-length control protein FliK [Roseobacter sp.]